ncbi:unnamed protein product, partial [Durusdinium trenchii]
VLRNLSPALAVFENVRAAAEFSYPKDAPPVQPPVKTVEQDVLELGYHFVYDILDSPDFLLPQRRQRVWGIASIITGHQSQKEIQDEYKLLLASMRSNMQFPMELNFPHAPTQALQAGRHTKLMQKAQAVTLASLVCCRGAWQTAGTSCESEKPILRRLKRKQPAPEYG